MNAPDAFDFLVIGSGPGGHKAAICAAKAGQRVALVEREPEIGGACVHRATIPSKTLREAALQISRLRAMPALVHADLCEELQIAHLTSRLDEVTAAHSRFLGEQLDRNGVIRLLGHARFVSNHEVEVTSPGGVRRRVRARFLVIAPGSRPRQPEGLVVDHEHVLDSDSILSLTYLPRSLTVLGAGVIASEYASIFVHLGVRVTMLDRASHPLPFLAPDLSRAFLASFEAAGGRWCGDVKVLDVAWDGVSRVIARLDDGSSVESEKMLVAAGRVGRVEGLGLEAAGLGADARGILATDEDGRTTVPHIYAVGDVAGPPALAASAMEQGRHAVRHALGLGVHPHARALPLGIYTVPEIATVGLGEDEAVRRHGGARVGRARFDEVARGQIAGAREGLLRIVADPAGDRLLGVEIFGEGATELIHVGQMALLAGLSVEDLVENVFNFPTFAEAYRIAALAILNAVVPAGHAAPTHPAVAVKLA